MRKLLAAAALLALASGFVTSGTSAHGTNFVFRDLKIRTISTGGTLDSTRASLGLKDSYDTSTVFAPVMPTAGYADSLNNLIVYVRLTGNLDAGDSIYVALDGSYNFGANWVTLNSGSIGKDGFVSGANITSQAIIGRVVFNAKENSTTNVTGVSPVLTPTQVYGSWWGYQTLRVRVRSDVSNDLAANAYQLYVTFPALEGR